MSSLQRPGNLVHSAPHWRLIDRLLSNRSIQRIAGFQSSKLICLTFSLRISDVILGAFASYAPKIYEHYVSTFKALYNHQPGLQHNFRNSIFPAITFNMGPDTITLDHEDPGNLPFGMCALTSLGPYDPKTGGHLILFQFRVVIQFPPGATILLPSATIRHANTAINPGESCMSTAQYAAGGLFRWKAYGFQSARSLLSKTGGQAEKSRIDGPGEVRWQRGLGLFSKFDQLSHDRKSVFGCRT